MFATRPDSKPSVSDVLERELEMLYRVAKRLTLNDPDAEDLVSQTIAIAFKSWDRFDGRHPRSWLVTILRNEWFQTLRKRKMRSETEFDAIHEPSDEGFWKSIDRKLEAEMIVEAVQTLAEEYRDAITLCDIEELSYDEAAEALGIPVGTIRSRLFRGRKILRSKLVSLTTN